MHAINIKRTLYDKGTIYIVLYCIDKIVYNKYNINSTV